MPTIACHTLGCKVNQYDTQAMLELFLAAGYTAVTPALDFVPKAGPESAVPAESGPVEVAATPAGIADQTGHPEVSAAGADVEKLLTVDPSYD